MEENLTHHKAFDLFYSLGDDMAVDERITRVASEFSRSKSTIYQWKKGFKWDEKKKSRDIKNAQKIEEKTDETILEAKSKYIDLIQDTLKEYRTALKNGDIKINSVQDLERLAKLEMLLRFEEATEDKVVNIMFKTAEHNVMQVDEEDKAMFEQAQKLDADVSDEPEKIKFNTNVVERPTSPYRPTRDDILDDNEKEDNKYDIDPYSGLIG